MSGIEVVAGLVLGAVGVISPVVDIASRLETRYRSFHENKKDVDDLLGSLTSLRAHRNGVRNQLVSQLCALPSTNLRHLLRYLADAEQVFAKADADLTEFRSRTGPVA
jgi:hypothetical protein